MFKRISFVLCLLATSSCAPLPGPLANTGDSSLRAPGGRETDVSPPQGNARSSGRPNGQIAQDYLDLAFQMESGVVLQSLSRFEGPVTYRLTGNIPATAPQDMAVLADQLRQEAGIDIRQTGSAEAANLTVEFAPRDVLKYQEPRASCFVAPNVTSLAEFRRRRGTADLSWQGLTRRERVAIFVPSDTSPQEVRDCLHEEVAQALGPLNDLYRLPDSVFNDDNVQSVLTPFDMLILRLHYAPTLQSGMNVAQVREVLPELLARQNPAGQIAGGWTSAETPRTWLQAVQTALDPKTPDALQRKAAGQMLAIAQARGWHDNRAGFAWFVLGRLQAQSDLLAAEQSFTAAAEVYAGLPDDGAHLAHALMQLSAIALATGRPDRAIELADRALPMARRAENAALQANLLLVKAQGLDLLGRGPEAEALRLDLAPIARYGFGSEAALRARAAEIALLARRG